MRKKNTVGFLLCGLVLSTGALAAVTAQEAEQLKTTLTPLGAERAGNKDGSIPSWDGGYKTVPAGYVSGEPRIDPFAKEKPLFSVTAKNMDQYADQLSDGSKALLKKYPSYRIDVYPTHRTASAPQWYYDNTLRNATKAKTTGGGLSVEGACGGVPFPIPKDGYEVMWNHLLAWKGEASKHHLRSYVVPSDGRFVLAGEAVNSQNFPYAGRTACEGFNGNFWDVLQVTIGPPFKAGETILLRDPVDQMGKGRQAWQYLVGQRRVRRAPTIGYDTPDSVNSGMNYFDEAFVFLGALDKFNWKLLGKKEMFIPYNNNAAWLAKPEELLGPKHVNPDVIRWERHRVWLVEATLAEGKRNVVPKRRFYVDEDSWNAVLYDGWDAQGQFWRTGFGLPVLVFELPGVVVQTFGVYNLLGNTYMLTSLPNGTDEQFKQVKPFPNSLFTPEALASGGIR